MEDLKLQGVLELAKHAEQIVKLQNSTSTMNSTSKSSHVGPLRNHGKSNGKSSNKKKFQINKNPLTDNEKSFLKMNIEREGGLLIRRKTEIKSAWQEWARRDGVYTKYAMKGHIWKQCKLESEATKAKNGKLNLMSTDHGGDVRSEMHDVEVYSES